MLASPFLKASPKPCLPWFGSSRMTVGFLKLIANHTPANACVQEATVYTVDLSDGGKSLSISELSGIWFVSFGFGLLGLSMTLFTYLKKRREKTIVRSLSRVDQHGQRLNRLERDDGWIHEEGVKVFYGPSRSFKVDYKRRYFFT